MDSISQGILGGAVGGLIGGRKLGKKAYRRGIVLGTVPDLDVFLGPLLYSDTLQAAAFHRGPTHSIFFAFLAAPIFAYLINKIHKGDKASRWTRTLIAFFVFLTHSLLDALTNYGTRLLRPFENTAYSFNSIFIVDPIYTIPFLLFFLVALIIRDHLRAWKINARGVGLSTAYLLFAIILKFAVINPVFNQALAQQDKEVTNSFITPEALQVFLRRQVAVTEDDFVQGWYSIFDSHRDIQYRSVPRMTELLDQYRRDDRVQKLIDTTQGYYLVRPRTQGGIILVDVRFGGLNGWEGEDQEYIFGYNIYEQDGKIIIGDRDRGSEGRAIEDDTLTIWWERVKGVK